MSKFLFYTDLHLSNIPPRHRKDDFGRTILSKLAEVYDIGKRNNVDFAVFGGDFFDVHRIYSYELISEAVNIISDSGFETYAIIGQHDLKGYNLGTYSTSVLAFLENHCKNWHTMYDETEVGDVVLCPCHANGDINEAMSRKIASSKVPVLVAHLLLHDTKAMFDVIPTSSVAHGPYVLVLSGDLHCGFEAHMHEGTVFCNPGSMARRTVADNRPVQCLVVDVTPQRDVSVETIEVSCVKPFADVFDESFVATVKSTASMDASRFVDGILEIEMESVDVFELVEKIGRQKGVRREVLEFISSKRCDT